MLFSLSRSVIDSVLSPTIYNLFYKMQFSLKRSVLSNNILYLLIKVILFRNLQNQEYTFLKKIGKPHFLSFGPAQGARAQCRGTALASKHFRGETAVYPLAVGHQ